MVLLVNSPQNNIQMEAITTNLNQDTVFNERFSEYSLNTGNANAFQKVEVFKVSCDSPSDLSKVYALIDDGVLNVSDIVAVIGKTEGNGCVNDYTRELATIAWTNFLTKHLNCTVAECESRVALVMSGGTEGILSPHFNIFSRRHLDSPMSVKEKRLVVGVAQTRAFAPEEIGRMEQIEETTKAVNEAIHDAGIADMNDVHFVQIKCPLLTSVQIQETLRRGHSPVTMDTYKSMAYSRGASAIGIAVALGEVDSKFVSNESVLTDWNLYSTRASASAGVEMQGNLVVVFGEAAGSASDYRIVHTYMKDSVDGKSVRTMLSEIFNNNEDEFGERIVNLFAKTEASPYGNIRGARHTMFTDSDIQPTRHARAATGGMLASIAGFTSLYVSGGAEHQGPAGGGPVAAIIKVG